jgi:hypothetical protein
MPGKYFVINCNHLFCELIPLLFGYLLRFSQEPLTEPYLCQLNSITTLASSTVDCKKILASKSRTSTMFFFRQAFQSKFSYPSFEHVNHQKNESSTPLSALQYRNMEEPHLKLRLVCSITKNIFTRRLYINRLEFVVLAYPQRRLFSTNVRRLVNK